MSRSIAVIDAETDPFKRGRVDIKPFIWGYYNGETYEEFTEIAVLPKALQRAAKKEGMRDISEFIPYLESQEIIVYAHNGGKFDYHFLLDFLEPFEKIMIIAGRLSKFKIGLCEFRDSMNIIPVALKEWQKEDFDYSILEKTERYKPLNWKKIRSYLQSDCLNLYNMVSAFIDRFGMHLTQAGASMKFWQELTGRKAPNSGLEFYNDFRPFYYGGRVECFEGGIIDEEFSVIDIKSAYPYGMLYEHPIGLEYSLNYNFDPDDIRGCDFYHIKGISHGSIPFRADDNTLFFPNDRIRREYFITGWELQAAIDTGAIDSDIELIVSYGFHELTDFKSFVEPLYNERKVARECGDKSTVLFNKLLMNSLYGKFAANPAEYGEFIVLDGEFTGIFTAVQNDEMKRGHLIDGLSGYGFAGELGPWVIGRRDLDEERHRYYNVATASSITGFVRAYLWRAICQCGGVMYCDTDSIAARDISAITQGDELGEWECEGLFQRAAIGGKKLYAFRYKKGTEPKNKNGKNICWKIASKGGRLTSSQIMRVCRGEQVTFEPESPTFSIFKDPKLHNRNFISTAKVTSNLNKDNIMTRINKGFEKIHQPLYSIMEVLPPTKEINFFQECKNDYGGNITRTNMFIPGQIPRPQHFLIESVELFCPYGNAFKSDWLDRCDIQIFVGSRTYYEDSMLTRYIGGRKIEDPILLQSNQYFSIRLSGPLYNSVLGVLNKPRFIALILNSYLYRSVA